MTISTSTANFFGKTVIEYDPAGPVDDSGNVVYRLSLRWDEVDTDMSELIDSYLARVDKNRLAALIIGTWGEPNDDGIGDVLATLVRHSAQLPALRALFVGDMTFEECEISWIEQGDYSDLLQAYPNLDVLRIRGGNNLVIAPFAHPNLRQLIIESGGLDDSVAIALSASSMPKLEHLEIWLGTSNYGFTGDVASYRALVANLQTPTLRYLGLRDAEIADDLALWLATEPLVAQLSTLDLSLGTLGDAGAEALFNSPHAAKLAHLDLRHHYISPAWQAKLRSLPFKVTLDEAQDPEDNDGDRYVAVGE